MASFSPLLPFMILVKKLLKSSAATELKESKSPILTTASIKIQQRVFK